jgi:hypothetical protein
MGRRHVRYTATSEERLVQEAIKFKEAAEGLQARDLFDFPTRKPFCPS